MGRFYKTATPNKIDFMYQIPENVMMQAIATKDQQLAQEEASIYDLYGKLNASALEVDKTRRDEILKGYESQIDELSRKFYDNPLEYSNNRGITRKLAREIHEDWTRGEVSNIIGNYNARTEFIKKYQDEITKGNVNAADFNSALKYFDANFQGTNYDKEKNKGNIYGTEDLVKRVSVEDIAEKRGAGYISDLTKTWGAHTDGQYIYKSVDSKETIPFEDIAQGVYNSLLNDKDVMDYYRQQVKFGAISAAEVDGMLKTAAARVAEKYDKNHVEKGRTDINADPYGLQRQKHELDKEMHAWKDTYENLKLMPSDRNNEQMVYDVTIGKSTKEIEGKLNDFKHKATEPLLNIKNNLYQKIDAMNLMPGKRDAMLSQINKAIDAAKSGNFNELNRVSGELGYGIQDPKTGQWVGTGVSEAESNYRNYTSQIQNQEALLTALKKGADSKVNADFDKLIEAERKKYAGVYKDETTLDYHMKAFKEKLEKTREQRRNNYVDQTLGDPEFQKHYQSVYSTAGNYYDDKDVPAEHKKVFNDYMQNLPKNMMDFAARNGNTKLIRADIRNNEKLEATSLDQLIRQQFITYEQIEELGNAKDGKITVASRTGGKPITYKIGATRVVPTDLGSGIGRNAKQLTIEIDDPNRKLPQTITLYVPEKDLPSPDAVKEVYKSKEVDTNADEMELNAERTFQNAFTRGVISKDDAWYTSPYSSNIKYNPFELSPSGVKGLWQFEDADGRQVKVYGDQGKELYKEALRGANQGDVYNREEMDKQIYGGKKSSSGFESKTTYK